MPSEFTIGELKQVYELILGRKLINSAFRRVIKDKVVSTDNYVKTGGHRPSCLFKYFSSPNEQALHVIPSIFKMVFFILFLIFKI